MQSRTPVWRDIVWLTTLQATWLKKLGRGAGCPLEYFNTMEKNTVSRFSLSANGIEADCTFFDCAATATLDITFIRLPGNWNIILNFFKGLL